MIDISTYTSLKEKKLISTLKVGDSYVLVIQKFNPDTGEKITPDFHPLTLAYCEECLAQFELNVERMKEFIADIMAVP